MKMKAKNLITTVGILLIILVLYILVSGQVLTKYLFIEVKTIENRTILSGNPHNNFVDGPTYDLEGSNLHSVMHPELDPSVKAIYGSWFQLTGDVDSGIGSGIHPIRNLPYIDGNISILNIQGDNVIMSYYGNSFTLAPGDSWKNETHQIEKREDAFLDVNTTIAIYNHGKVTLS